MGRTIRCSRARSPWLLAGLAMVLVAPWNAVNSQTSRTQWAGPDQNSATPTGKLASEWPEGGPKTLWERPLGEGYSSILAENNRLYTMYRTHDDEVIVSLDAATGDTLWEFRYAAPYDRQKGYGEGPRSTPLIVDDLLFAVGIGARMHALDKNSGRVLWTRDLFEDFPNATRHAHGYSSSPIAYGDTVIVPVGGEGSGLVALNQEDGGIAWQALDFRNSYSSPRLLDIDGESQLVIFMANELIGVDPEDGELLWRYPHANQWGANISMPILAEGNTLFLSSPQAGARGLRIERDGDETRVEQIWSTRRVQFYHASTVLQGDWIYGSTGVTSPAFMTAINIRTGKIGWKLRGFAKANCVETDGRLIILDEDGILYLATATPEDLVVHAQTQLLDRVAWTAPTIVGSTLYARDNEQILAVDLG